MRTIGRMRSTPLSTGSGHRRGRGERSFARALADAIAGMVCMTGGDIRGDPCRRGEKSFAPTDVGSVAGTLADAVAGMVCMTGGDIRGDPCRRGERFFAPTDVGTVARALGDTVAVAESSTIHIIPCTWFGMITNSSNLTWG